MTAAAPTTAPTSEKLPPQVPYIIGNEACERFSFYGMRNILTVFLMDYLLVQELADPSARQATAKSTFHLFVAGVYFFPLLGGWLADRWLGKYRTILYISVLYVIGHVMLAAFESDKHGFHAGLFLIALGSGGIKPCVSAMVGDQFDASRKHLASKVFSIFYWSINFGSFFASLLIPKTLKLYGPTVAFGIPGVLMAIALVVFWAGRHTYVKVPPSGPSPDGFWPVVRSALGHRRPGLAHWLDAAKGHHPAEAVEGAKAVFRVLSVFLLVPFFWMLFDQKASTWVVQAKSMDPDVFGWTFEPSQMQLVNPALVMTLIPLTTGVLYPAMRRAGIEPTPLRRMTWGLFFGAASYVVAGFIQLPIEGGERLSILWQLAPYLLLTIGEILVSTTGLEFAYSQAPHTMKGALMSLWNLTVAAANLAVALAAALNVFTGVGQFFFYAGLAALAGLAMARVARTYVQVDYYGPPR